MHVHNTNTVSLSDSINHVMALSESIQKQLGKVTAVVAMVKSFNTRFLSPVCQPLSQDQVVEVWGVECCPQYDPVYQYLV